MTDTVAAPAMAQPATAGVPWHLWAVGGLSLLWNALGCYIYTMTMLRDPGMMAQTPPEVRALLDTTPAWATAGWAFGVWGALAGSLLLLMRSRWAVAAFAVSLAGLALTAVYELGARYPMNPVQSAMIWGAAILLLWYAWAMRRRGVLR